MTCSGSDTEIVADVSTHIRACSEEIAHEARKVGSMGQLATQSGVDIHVGGSFSGQIAIGEHILQIGSISGGVVNIISPEQRPVPKPRPTPVNARPRAFRDLLGREEEVGKALAALRSAEPVEVYGHTGLGKTSLLRHLAHHRVSESFTDGVVYTRVERKTVEDSSQEIFQAFFDCDVPFKPTDVQLRLHLGDKKALILLDDVEWGREDVERLLNAAPGCVFVLGSPERHLWDEGCPIALRGLPIDAALTLIEQRLGRAITPREKSLAQALCKATGRHPLRLVQAIGLVQNGSKTLAELASELVSESPERSLAKRAVASCTESEKRALAVLAALGGLSASTKHLGALAELETPHDVLGSLRERGLILTEGSRCRLAGMLVKPLAKKWDLSPSSKRALRFYAAWADRREVAKDHARILEEADVLLHSLTWGVQAQRWRQVLQLGRAMEDALALSGRWGAWRQVLDAQLQAARALGDRDAEARALHQLGTRNLCLGQVAPARSFLTSALTMREALGDELGAEITRHNLSLLPQVAPLDSQNSPSQGHGRVPARWWTIPMVCLLLVLNGGRMGRDAWPAVQIESVALEPHLLAGGAHAQGVVTLTTAAPGVVEIALSSDRPDLIIEMPRSVRVEAGEHTAKFAVATHSVAVPTDLLIAADRGGAKKTAALRLLVAERPRQAPPEEPAPSDDEQESSPPQEPETHPGSEPASGPAAPGAGGPPAPAPGGAADNPPAVPGNPGGDSGTPGSTSTSSGGGIPGPPGTPIPTSTGPAGVPGGYGPPTDPGLPILPVPGWPPRQPPPRQPLPLPPPPPRGSGTTVPPPTGTTNPPRTGTTNPPNTGTTNPLNSGTTDPPKTDTPPRKDPGQVGTSQGGSVSVVRQPNPPKSGSSTWPPSTVPVKSIGNAGSAGPGTGVTQPGRAGGLRPGGSGGTSVRPTGGPVPGQGSRGSSGFVPTPGRPGTGGMMPGRPGTGGMMPGRPGSGGTMPGRPGSGGMMHGSRRR
jgi:hypothetical protein